MRRNAVQRTACAQRADVRHADAPGKARCHELHFAGKRPTQSRAGIDGTRYAAAAGGRAGRVSGNTHGAEPVEGDVEQPKVDEPVDVRRDVREPASPAVTVLGWPLQV